MDDVTDTVFRRVVWDCAPYDMSMTEFVNVDGLCSPGRPRLMSKLRTDQDTGLVAAQIWGKKPENFVTIAREIANGTIAGFDSIDINFGCPAKAEVRAECCSAMQQLHLRPQAQDIIEATLQGAGDMPVSFKTRLGFDHIDYTWHAFLLQFQPSMLTVHVRTTKQMSKVPAQWDAVEEIVRLRDQISPNTKIIMNGDIMNRQHGDELAQTHGVDGTMIGRGVFQDPYCFAESGSDMLPWAEVSRADKLALLRKHFDLFAQTYTDNERPYAPLKKFVKIYVSGFDGASELRQRIMDTDNLTGGYAAIDAG